MQKIIKSLKNIEEKINDQNFKIDITDICNFSGADVIISSKMNSRLKEFINDTPFIVNLDSQDFVEEKHRVIITKYSKELSWLFFKLRDIFKDKIDFSNKFQFYGILAEAAKNKLQKNPNCSLNDLLRSVLNHGAWKYFFIIERYKNNEIN